MNCTCVWAGDPMSRPKCPIHEQSCPSCAAKDARIKELEKYESIFIDDPGNVCWGCGGKGRRLYPSTATWHGGIGGQALTEDVCDVCWGSGSKSWQGTDLRELRGKLSTLESRAEKAEAELAAFRAENEKLRKALERAKDVEGLAMMLCFCACAYDDDLIELSAEAYWKTVSKGLKEDWISRAAAVSRWIREDRAALKKLEEGEE